MKILIILMLLVVFNTTSNAQDMYNNAKPISLGYKNQYLIKDAKKIKTIQEIPARIVEGLDLKSLQNELDERHEQDSNFTPVAKSISVNIDVIKEGTWENLSDSYRLCRKKVRVENSSSLILVFEKFFIPKEASLLIFDSEGKMVLGPLSPEINKPSKKFMTGIIQGPEIIFEYLEKNGINERPEIAISNIGVAFRYDYGKSKNKDNNDEILTTPPVTVDIPSDYIPGQYEPEGCTALCKVADTIGFSDPVGKIVTSSCLFLYFRTENGWFDYKPAVLIRGKDNCTPYIATAGHVTWPTDNYEDYCVVRFNWLRKRPSNASGDVSQNNISNCLWDTTTNWNTTIDLTKVIDYCGATLKRGFPCNETWGLGYDLSILQINSKLIHRAWMAGWDARNFVGRNDTNNTIILSRFGGIPLMYSEGDITVSSPEYYRYQQEDNLPLKVKVGYSGSPAFSPSYNGSTNEYLYIGPITKGIGSVCSGTLLYKPYSNSMACPGNLTELHKPLVSLLHDPNNANADYQFGVWYNPDSCSTNTTECCNFYYATKNAYASTPNANDTCCNEFEIQERIIDSFLAGDTCGIYIVKIYLEGDEANPITFQRLDGTIWNSVNSDNIIGSAFKGTQGIRRYKICSPMPDGSQALIQNYWIKFYHGDNVIDSCQKEFLFKCKPECYCDKDRYNIILDKTGETEDGKCCYKAKICFIADSLYKYKFDTCRTEYQNRGNVPSCQSAFISVSAGRDVFDITKPRDCLQFNGIRHITNYWTRDEALIRNPNCSDTAIIENICIEDPHESYLIFSFLQEPYVGNDLSIIPGLDCKQKVPIEPCNCCDAIEFKPNDTTCSYGFVYEIVQLNNYTCNINFNNLSVETIMTDYNGNEISLGYLNSNTNPPEYDYNSSQLTIRKRYMYDYYVNSANDTLYLNTNIKYRVHFKKSDNSDSCTKDLEVIPCFEDCLDNMMIDFSRSTGDCLTKLKISELIFKYNQITIDSLKPNKQWLTKNQGPISETIDYEITLYPGVYRIRFGQSNCYYYFVVGCWECQSSKNNADSLLMVDIEKISNTCCYKIKSNRNATVKIYDINDTTTVLCTLTQTVSSPNFYYGNTNCTYLCNNGDRAKKILVKFSDFKSYNFDGECWRVLTLPPCSDMDICCDSADVEIIRHPGNDVEKTCCYKFNINNVGCNIAEVKIYDGIVNDSNLIATVPTSFINVSQLSDIMDWVCFAKGQFANKTITIVMSDGGSPPHLCTLTDSIPPCWEIPTPCNPNPIDTVWTNNEEGTIEFDCIDGTDTIDCTVTFTYTYRHSSIDNSNDVQILAYHANASCLCEAEIIDRILKYIWSQQTVMDKFLVYEDDPNWDNGDTNCFINYRVITNDCWQTNENVICKLGDSQPPVYVLGYLLKRCPSNECCFAWYKVCYYKNENGIIKFSRYERLSNISNPVQSCQPYKNKLCKNGNCINWLPTGTGHIPPSTNIENNQQIPCNIYVVSENTSDETMIRFDCMINGKVSLYIYDLLGRQEIEEDVEKKEVTIKIPVRKKLQPGIYFIKLNINNNMAYYNKFIISE